MFKGFREFILRGNVIDLAVAVVIGAAFSKIVDVVVTALVDPLISLFFQADSLDQALQVTVPTITGGEVVFAFGAIIGAIINFLAVALVVYFAFVAPMNRAKRKSAAEEDPAAPSEQELLTEIRDLLRQSAQK